MKYIPSHMLNIITDSYESSETLVIDPNEVS